LYFALTLNTQNFSVKSTNQAVEPKIPKALLSDQSPDGTLVNFKRIVSVVNNTGAEDDCVATNPSNAFENGEGCSAGFGSTTANNYIVPAGNNATLNSITPIFLMRPGGVVNTVDITIYDDAGELPGAVIDTQLGVVPTSHNVVGSNFGYDFNEVVMDLTPVFLAGDAGSDTNYWVAIQVSNSNGGRTFWEVSSASAIGAPTAYNNGAGSKIKSWDGVYTYNAVCSPLAFPLPYCSPLVHIEAVEPITNVEFADIANRTDETVNGTPGHEDFTSKIGQVTAGESYEIILEGFTAGNFENRFAVFIDWNQNDIFDTDEVYEIATIITGSTGEDGQQATQILEVPEGTTVGVTRMRVKKIYKLDSYLDPCLGSGNGQAEDYTVSVGTLSNTSFNSTDFTYYPNPVNDILSISTASTVDNIKVYNMLGQLVLETAALSYPQVDMKELQFGVYLVTLEVEGSLQTFRVIKQ
jgi:hypothetical protein